MRVYTRAPGSLSSQPLPARFTTRILTRAHTLRHTHAHIHIHIFHTHACTHMYAYSHAHTRTHTHTLTLSHSHTHILSHSCVHTCTYIHIHTRWARACPWSQAPPGPPVLGTWASSLPPCHLHSRVPRAVLRRGLCHLPVLAPAALWVSSWEASRPCSMVAWCGDVGVWVLGVVSPACSVGCSKSSGDCSL